MSKHKYLCGACHTATEIEMPERHVVEAKCECHNCTDLRTGSTALKYIVSGIMVVAFCAFAGCFISNETDIRKIEALRKVGVDMQVDRNFDVHPKPNVEEKK